MRKFSKKNNKTHTSSSKHIFPFSLCVLKMADTIQPNNIYITRQYIEKRPREGEQGGYSGNEMMMIYRWRVDINSGKKRDTPSS